jgi:hypothetical protein
MYDEYDILASDTTIELFDHPLDYELLEEGEFYHDPTIPPDQPTWQYTAVQSSEADFDNIPHEVVEELYVPEDDSDILEPTGEIQTKWLPVVDALEQEAFKLTGNQIEQVTPRARAQGSSWRPSGTIKLYDDYLKKDMPVVGAKVRARRWFTFHRDLTDHSGYFSVDGTFRRPANYSIKWERADWDIRSGTFGQAYYNGPKKEGPWNLTISSGMSRLYAIVHTALRDYYYGNRLGLRSPPKDSFWKVRLKVAVYDNNNGLGSHCEDCKPFGLLPRLYIHSSNRLVNEIYATTIHEIAHASHWELRKFGWGDTEDKVKESWARGVQWEITRLRYPDYPGGDIVRPKYTQVVVDMIDEQAALNPVNGQPLNQNNGSEILSEDNVSGYTIKQIEDVLPNVSSWNGWKNEVKNRYVNTTENNLDALFAHWN